MNQFKTKFSKRKFYNKYSYKITLKFDANLWLFRNNIHSLEPIKSDLRNLEHLDFYRVAKVIDFLKDHPNKDILKRIEGKCVDFYTNDLDTFNELTENFHDIVKHRFMMYPDSVDEDPFIIKVNKYPYDRYQYKVYLKPHKLKDHIEDKIKYLDWISTQNNRILISDSVKQWFIKTFWNWDRRYIYVEDEPTLLMLSMRNPEVLGRVYKHVIR